MIRSWGHIDRPEEKAVLVPLNELAFFTDKIKKMYILLYCTCLHKFRGKHWISRSAGFLRKPADLDLRCLKMFSVQDNSELSLSSSSLIRSIDQSLLYSNRKRSMIKKKATWESINVTTISFPYNNIQYTNGIQKKVFRLSH